MALDVIDWIFFLKIIGVIRFNASFNLGLSPLKTAADLVTPVIFGKNTWTVISKTIKMLYLIGPDGLVNWHNANFRKIV